LDASKTPQIKYNRVPLSQLANLGKDSSVDVIVIAYQISEAVTITSKTTHRELIKREVVVVDESMYQCRLTLWGKEAEDFNCPGYSVLALKNSKVSDFGGRALSGGSLVINPDIKEAHILRGWYGSYQGEFMTFENLVVQSTAKSEVYKHAAQVKDERLGCGDKVREQYN
jgi:replication factor A1